MIDFEKQPSHSHDEDEIHQEWKYRNKYVLENKWGKFNGKMKHN